MKIDFTLPKNSVSVSFHEGKVARLEDSSLVVGIDDSKKLTTRKLRTLVRKIIRVAKENEISHLTVDVKILPNPEKLSDEELGRLFVENALMAEYEFTTYKSKKKERYDSIKALHVVHANTAFKKGAMVGEIVAGEINAARDLANTPGKDMTPTVLAKAAQKAARGLPITVTILEKKDAERLGMGLILGVDRGSAEPMKFIVMEYWGAGKTAKEKPILLVGKGITFDTGGINLKPGEGLLGMNQDMTGGATVIAAVISAAKLEIKKNVVALVPAVENAISGSAYRPGDILRSMSGTTVEIGNTDAEGRLVLADALTYAKHYNPRLVIDVATLTGAAIVVAGKRASVIMTRQSNLESTLKTLGEESGDYVIPLPLWEEYETDLKSNIADISNVNGPGPSAKSGAGSIQGGTFLAHFAQSFSAWVHIDMASRMESIPEDNLAPGSTGTPVRLLVRILEGY